MKTASDRAYLQNRAYLQDTQYRDASNLDARAQLHARFSVNKQGWHPWVFQQLEIPSPAVILELGCGPGWLWAENLSRIDDGWEIFLSDLSRGMLGTARERLADGAARFRFCAADAQAIPFAADTFDAVVANHMLYHVPDRHAAFAEIQRVLKPGGRLYAATNGKGHLVELDDLLKQAGIETAFGPERGFRLEDGEAQLAPWFTDIRMIRYPDALQVTEVEPLVAYARSMRRPGDQGETLARFARVVAGRIAASGTLRIGKDSGLFVARRRA